MLRQVETSLMHNQETSLELFMATLSIRLLGGLTVEYAGEDRTALFSGRVRALLAFLLLQADRPHARQSIAFMLWPDSRDKQARTNLRKLLMLLRGALGPAETYLEITDATLSWRSDPSCWLDVQAFDDYINAASDLNVADAAPLDAARPLCQATDLYRGDLLPDCYDEWIVAARESLRDGYINALDQLCTLFERARRYADGVAAARRLLQHDPIYERGHLHRIRLQALMNDRTGALQSYHRCATLLRRELGVDPSPAMESLYLQLLDHDLAPADASNGTLPTTLTRSASASAPVSASLSIAQSHEQASSIPLVGRQPAWQQLLRHWQQAQQGHAHFALIVGEAGIGKSRLAEEMMLWVERQGNAVAHARAYGSDNRTLTLAPVAGLLRVASVREQITTLEPTWLTEIARLLPELLLEHPDVPAPQPMVDDWQRHHLFAALNRALQPSRLPRLLVIDDLQWSDAETLAWLPYLLEHAKQAQLMVVGTVRSEEFDDYAALQAMCDTLRRRGQLDEITLGPLGAAEITELAHQVVGQPLDDHHAQWLAGTTEGNPLFVVETARLLQDESTAAAVSPAALGMGDMRPHVPVLTMLPNSVRAVIDARLARLSQTARTLAEVAATIGRSFAMPVLRAASALDENALVDALDELWRRRIIREGSDGDYDFSHDRIRDGAYAGISPLRRRLLHERVAAAIVETQRGTLDEASGQLGYHYEQANERLAALEQYMRAAKVAAAQYALTEALYYFDRVLALAAPDEIDLRFKALQHRERVLLLSGSLTTWEENVRQLEQIAAGDATDDSTDQTTLRRRAIAAECAARLAQRMNLPNRALEKARAAVKYAEQTDDLNLQAVCNYTLGYRLWFIADFVAALPYIARAIEQARAVSDFETLALALELRAATLMFSGGAATAIEPLLQECLINYDKAGSLAGRSQILNKIGYLQFAQGTGSYDGALVAMQGAIELAQQMGSPMAEVIPRRNLGILYTCMGNYAAAEATYRRLAEIMQAMGSHGMDSVVLNYRGFLYLNQGRLADALEIQQQAVVALATENYGQWRVKALTALAWIHLRLEKPQEALVYANMALDECAKFNERRQEAYTLIVRGILRTMGGDLCAARQDFSAAHTILCAFEMFNRALEAQVGLAYLDLLEGHHDAALASAHEILAHLEAHPVDFTEDVCQLLLTCQHILQRLDPDACPRLRKLIDLHLATRTATLDDATAKLFWQIPAHQALRTACAVSVV